MKITKHSYSRIAISGRSSTITKIQKSLNDVLDVFDNGKYPVITNSQSNIIIEWQDDYDCTTGWMHLSAIVNEYKVSCEGYQLSPFTRSNFNAAKDGESKLLFKSYKDGLSLLAFLDKIKKVNHFYDCSIIYPCTNLFIRAFYDQNAHSYIDGYRSIFTCDGCGNTSFNKKSGELISNFEKCIQEPSTYATDFDMYHDDIGDWKCSSCGMTWYNVRNVLKSKYCEINSEIHRIQKVNETRRDICQRIVQEQRKSYWKNKVGSSVDGSKSKNIENSEGGTVYTESSFLADDKIWLDELGPNERSKLCGVANCKEKAVNQHDICRYHIYESVFDRPCPFQNFNG
jgi:hypothetical protein